MVESDCDCGLLILLPGSGERVDLVYLIVCYLFRFVEEMVDFDLG